MGGDKVIGRAKGRDRNRAFSGTILLTLALMIAAAILATAISLYFAANGSDAVSVERQARSAQHAMELSIDELALEQETVAIWDDSAKKLTSRKIDLRWVHDNIGIWLHRIYRHDEDIILDGSDHPVYAAVGGRAAPLARFAAIESDLRPLIDSVRGRDGGPVGRHDRSPGRPLASDSTVRTTSRATHDSHMLLVGGRPAAASAMLIQPSTPGYAVPRGKWPVLLSIRYLDRDFLQDLSTRQLIANPRFSRWSRHTPAETAVPLHSEREGTIGYLVWYPELPGTRVFWKILPVNMTVLALLSLFILLLGRKLGRASRELTAAEAQAAYLALHDALTGLPNRALFQKTLDGLIAQNSPHKGRFALILLDVDNFKLTNDTLGHDAGDALLRSFAERLSETVRPKDLVARLGGDEFALLLDGVDTPEAIEAFTSRLLELLRRPYTYGATTIESQASIGASIGGVENTAEELLKRADLALYAAKNAGRGVFRLYNPTMEAGMLDRSNQLSGAKRAMDQDLIRPFYQPQVDLSTGNVLGFEALLRWCTPSGPPHGPQRVAAALEDSSLGPQLSERIIDLVIQDVLTWRSQGLQFGHVAINVAAADLRRPDFASQLYAKLRAARLPTSCIQIEITEQVLLGRASDQVGQTLFDLAALGIKLAWDDFGTGFASLSHLKNYPVGVIKIDKTFVRDIHIDTESRAIVGAIIGLAQALDIEVVAEGVETKAQRELLLALDCPVGQGYLFGKAMPAAEASLRLGRCPTKTATLDPLPHSPNNPAGPGPFSPAAEPGMPNRAASSGGDAGAPASWRPDL